MALNVKQFIGLLPKLARRYELVIVNDGSTDATKKLATKLAKKHSFIRLVNHSKNLGYGASLRSGFATAKYDWVFFTDGDLQFDPEQLRDFLPHTKNFDVVIGYRTNRADGFRRALNARLFKLYIDLLFRLHVRDIDCAFKLLKRKVIQSLSLSSTGAFTSAEFLYLLKKRGYHFRQLPVKHLPRQFGTSTGSNPKVIVKAGWEALRLYLHLKRDQLRAQLAT